MKIDLESLSYEQLLELNHLIVERLKYLDSTSTRKEMSKFNEGDEVSFAHPTLGKQTGVLLKHNVKTVTVVTQSGQRWNVSPHLLRKVISDKGGHKKAGAIIEIKKK